MKAKNCNILFFLTRSLFLGFGLDMIFDCSGKDTWLGIILGALLGLGFTYLFSLINEKKKDIPLKELFKNHRLVGFFTRIFYLFVSILILVYILIIYKIFVVSFLLVSSPEIYVTIPFILLILYCAFKGIKVISRVANSLLPISILLIVIILFSLTGFIETTNFFPLLTMKPMGLFQTMIIYAGISTFPNVLMFQIRGESKGMMKMYLFSSLTLLLAAISINGVLGEALVQIFRFPEYMVLKQIKLFVFIEKVENILSVVWILDLFITGVMATYSIKELLPTKKSKIWTSLVILGLIYIIDNFFAFNYVNELKIYFILPYVSISISVIMIILMFYLIKRKKNLDKKSTT